MRLTYFTAVVTFTDFELESATLTIKTTDKTSARDIAVKFIERRLPKNTVYDLKVKSGKPCKDC